MKNKNVVTIFTLAGLFSVGAPAQTTLNEAPASASTPSIPLIYVGPATRLSVNVNQDGDFTGEGLGIFGYDGDSAWLGEGYIGQGGRGGLKVGFNFLVGGDARAAIDSPDKLWVAKVFAALDRNEFGDRKVSVGGGYEKKDVYFTAYYAHGLSNERYLETLRPDQRVSTITGVDSSGRPFIDTTTTTTIIDVFEQAYEHGLGLRLGRYFEPKLFRLRGGVDYETGDFDSSQFTVSLGIDKYIPNTGFSISLDAEHLSKSGDFEIFGSDTRGNVALRYDFGNTYRSAAWEDAAAYNAIAPPPTPPPVKAPEPIVVRNEISIDSDVFFDFDKSALREDATSTLNELITKINGAKLISGITIIGHTCDIGSDAYNQGLSQRRASSVEGFFRQNKIDDGLLVDGKGELAPKFPNDGPENRRKNRRVDISFLTVEESTRPGEPVSAPPNTEWTKRTVDVPPGWVERALKNMADHKRAVDVFRFEKSTTTSDTQRSLLNRPPVAVNDSAAVPRNSAAFLIAVLANDSDPDGDPLVISTATQGSNGTVMMASGNRELLYTPARNFVGSDSFTYTISDGKGGSATATVSVTVADRAPQAQDDTAMTGRNIPVEIDVLANDRDPEGDPLTITQVGTPANGRAEITSNRVRYTPNNNFLGVDTFSYSVRDPAGNTASAQVRVTVSNAAPIARDDTATARAGQEITIDVLANDSDPDGDAISLVSVGNPSNGEARISGGRVTYRSTSIFVGAASFTYTIRDAGGLTASATVRITVSPNLAPIANPDTASIFKGQTVDIAVLENDSDPENDPLRLTRIVTQGIQGTSTIVGDVVRYVHRPGTQGDDQVEYEIVDTAGNTAIGVIRINIRKIPQP